MPLLDKTLSEIGFLEALLGIIAAWILVDLWQTFIRTLFFKHFGLNSESAANTFFVASLITILFVLGSLLLSGTKYIPAI